MKKLDILILSNAKTFGHYMMVQNCIDSILSSSKDIQFNIIVTETAKTAPQALQLEFVGERQYLVMPMADILHCGGYKLPARGCTSAWVEEFYDSLWVHYRPSGFEKFVKTLPVPHGYKAGGKISYLGATTVPAPDPFNYNECINYCLDNHITSDWLVVQNSDTIAHPGAYDEIFKAHETYGYESLSPKSDIHAGDQIKITDVQVGYKILREISGFCIMAKRSVFAQFPGGHMDHQFYFLHQDCDYSMMLMKLKIKHALVPQAIVSHNHEQTHEPKEIHMAWSKECTRRFFFKWPSDYGVWATGNHSGTWSKEVIFDKAWTETYAMYLKENYGKLPGYGEMTQEQAPAPAPEPPVIPPAPSDPVIKKHGGGRPKGKKRTVAPQ